MGVIVPKRHFLFRSSKRIGIDMPWKKKPFGWGKLLSGASLFPPVQDATVAVLNQVNDLIREDASIQGITFRVDTLEPPSVELAIQSMLDRANSKLSFECVPDSIPDPDPRTSSAINPLWKYSKNKPVPAFAQPVDEFAKACATIVTSSKDCVDSWQRAKERSPDFTVDQVESLLAVMVFPSPVETGFESTEWVRRNQLAAAQLATNVEKLNGVRIADSKVVDIINGPLDWSTDSAMVALAQRVSEEFELIDEVRSIVHRTSARVPAGGTWSCSAVAKGVLKFLDIAARQSETAQQSESATESLSSN